MNKRMGTLVVLVCLLLASFTTIISDTSDAWSGTTIQPEHLGDTTYLYNASEVTSFTFPECKGIPVMNELYDASTSIYISIYLLSSKEVLSLLCEKADAGLDVKILTDGTPLGVTLEKEALMQLDQQYHADVRLINYTGAKGTEFDYLHNKYAIIDGDTVIITSENWTQGNFSSNTGNRGWGTIIKSTDYAGYMNNIFQKDFVDDDDVNKIEDVYDKSIAKTDAYTPYTAKTYTTVQKDTNVKVYPVHSPDTSYTIMQEFMATATSRLYVEMLDVSDAYIDFTKSTSPIYWMVQQSKTCSDVKYILDTSYETKKDQSHSQLIYDLNHQTDVKASHISGGKGFSITHNKGIIADNAVWVGSVNMTPTSFKEDREVAVIIYSAKIADYYAGYFTTDFNNNYDPNYAPGEYTPIDRVVDEVTEHPWYLAVLAVAIAAIGVFVKKVLIGGAKGGKKGAKKAAKKSGMSAAKKVAKSAVKEYSKSSKKKK